MLGCQCMSEGREAAGNESSSNFARRDVVDLNKVADLASKRGMNDVAEKLRKSAKLPSRAPLHTEQQQSDVPAGQEVSPQLTEPPVSSENHPVASSDQVHFFDKQEVDAMLNALEQAKRLPVPEGEQPGW